jgi:glycosidase
MAMPTWPRYPSIYEINTWVWLSELGTKKGSPPDLASVPAGEWDRLASLGVDAVWLMGVWERSPVGTAIANRNGDLLADFRRALPDFRAEDNVGSPYCVRRYVVDPHCGGPEGLARARRELARRGMRLILDFVPNHVAPDHPWVNEHPEYFIQASAEEARNHPGSCLIGDDAIYACGRDPYFPPWPDVVQLNVFDRGLRQAARDTLLDIASQCDGVRCDMAMLVLNDVFERTWGNRAGAKPSTEYWTELIPAIKGAHPGFLWMAEAYWDLEWQLQQLGFDFCYDKRLYDRLEHDNAVGVRMHLCAEREYQDKLVRFVENHDEPRAAAAFPAAKARAAAVATYTLPGARLFHEGQFDGRKVRLPVFLARRLEESPDLELREFYTRLVDTTTSPALMDGHWRLCELSGWPDNASHLNIVAWCWEKDEDRFVSAVNLSDTAAQARIRLDWNDLAGHVWILDDKLSGAAYERSGDDLANSGLYVDLGPWGCHVFECQGVFDSTIASRLSAPGLSVPR